MDATENTKYVDEDYGTLASSNKTRSVRLKDETKKSIFGKFKEFRKKRLETKLEEAQKSVNEMEIERKLSTKAEATDLREKIAEKSAAIAKLEEKLNVLKGNSRVSGLKRKAIKLKQNMMDNVLKNTKNAYIESTEEVVKALPLKEPENQDLVSKEEVKSEVDKAIEDVVSNEPISREIVDSTIKNEFNNIDIPEKEPTPENVINESEVNEVVNDAMENVRVSRNSTSPARFNKFINDDGTYHLRKEDIDEDFRITRVNKTPEFSINESSFNEPPKEEAIPDVTTSNINDDIFGKGEPVSMNNNIFEEKPTSNETNDDSRISSYEALSNAIDNATTKDEMLATLMNIVKQRKEEQAKSKEAAIRAEQAKLESEQKRAATMDKFRKYAEALAEDINYNEEMAKESNEARESNERDIAAMEDLIQPEATNVQIDDESPKTR